MRLRSSSGGVNSQTRFFFCLAQGSEKKRWEFRSPTSQYRFELQKFQTNSTLFGDFTEFPWEFWLFSKFCWITGKIRWEKSLRCEWSFLNHVLLEPKVFSEHNFSLCSNLFLWDKKWKLENILFLFFCGTGRKPTHDFLSLYSHSTAQQDPLPASQGILF